jgi:hypothetical protein
LIEEDADVAYWRARAERAEEENAKLRGQVEASEARIGELSEQET